MKSNAELHCAPRLALLSHGQIERIHRATLKILETVGVRVLDREAVDLLRRAGCKVEGDDLVFIPAGLVDAALASTPARVRIFDRQGREAMDLGGRRVYFGLGTDLLNFYDLTSGRLRAATLEDVEQAAVVADACPQIDFVASSGFPTELPRGLAYLAAFKSMIHNSTKPIYFTAAGREDLAFMVEMAAAVAGGRGGLQERPFIIHYAEPLSPLVHTRQGVQKLLFCADHRIPLNYVPALMAGGTGPVTLAGAIAVANAEALSGLVIHQLRAPGAPMISGFSATPLDMKTGCTVYGSPEERLTHTACTELYRHYGLPVWGEAGCSDAKRLDEQAAIEGAISIVMAALEGCNLVHDVGYLGQGLIGSLAAIVMGDEVIGYARRLLRGFSLDDDHLGLDVIKEVGPGGNFIATEHTLRFFRQEHWQPQLASRDDIDTWKAKGEKGLGELAGERAREILAAHRPPPLEPEVATNLEEIYRRAAALATASSGK